MATDVINEFEEKEKIATFDLLAQKYFYHNFGQLSKTDFETLLFSAFLEHHLNNQKEYDDYSLAVQLGISESKVRSLKVKKQLQYPHKGYEWQKEFLQCIQYAKYDEKTNLVKVSIGDPNVKRDIEHYLEVNHWFLEYQLNTKLLQMRADQFIELCMKLYSTCYTVDESFEKEREKQLIDSLKKSRSGEWLEKQESLLQKITNEGLQSCWSDVLKEIIKIGGKTAFKEVMKFIPLSSVFEEQIYAFIDKI